MVRVAVRGRYLAVDPSVAIHVNGLSKRFRLGSRIRYRRLGESIVSATKRAVRRAEAARLRTLWAVRDVSFDVAQGDVLGVIGRNGAGKSVLFSMLARIIRPTEGFADVRGKVAALIEVGTGFHPELTGRENVYLNGAILGMTRAEISHKFDDIVSFSELERFIDTPVKRYSSGMKVRLGFSVAAHLDPDVLLLDEVLAVGDVGFLERCNRRIEEIAASGTTILYVSHHLDDVRKLCRRVLWLDEGRIVQVGEPGYVIDAYAKCFTSADMRAAEGRLVTFEGWEVVEGAGGAHTVADDRSVRLAFRLRAHRRVSVREFGLFLDDQDRVTMGAWSGSFELEKGLNTIFADFPVWPVAPGMYHLRILVRGLERRGDAFHCVPHLTVVSDRRQGLSPRGIGVLNVPCRFEARTRAPVDPA